MKIELPKQDGLETGRLELIFVSCTKTYKFLWFQALLTLLKEEYTKRTYFRSIELLEIMFAKSWSDVLNDDFGLEENDRLLIATRRLQQITRLSNSATEQVVRDCLKEYRQESNRHSLEHRDEVTDIMNYFLHDVPYRFLSPWIHFESNEQVISESKQLTNDCLYSLHDNGKEKLLIVSNPNWISYLINHYNLLIDLTKCALNEFISNRINKLQNIKNADPYLLKRIERLRKALAEKSEECNSKSIQIDKLKTENRRLRNKKPISINVDHIVNNGQFNGVCDNSTITNNKNHKQ